jgi:hypothetical protein
MGVLDMAGKCLNGLNGAQEFRESQIVAAKSASVIAGAQLRCLVHLHHFQITYGRLWFTGGAMPFGPLPTECIGELGDADVPVSKNP